MSISTEIKRISDAKRAIIEAIKLKNVEIPDNIAIEDIPTYIASIVQVKPDFANSIEECADTSKVYVLPDGYIYAYLYTEITVEPTNEIPKSTDTDRKTIYNGKGWKSSMRIKSDGSIVTHTDSAMGVTGFIPAKVGDVIEATNYIPNSAYTSYIASYDSSNVLTGKRALTSSTSFPITLDASTFGSNFNAIRISGNITDTTSVINKSNGGTTTGYQWTNTGHKLGTI